MAQEIATAGLGPMLQKLWSIESQLVVAMPLMVEKATHLGLRKNLAMHFEETRQQKTSIEAMCKQMGIDAKAGEPDQGLQQILLEGAQKMQTASGNDINAVIADGAQKIEMYEMEVYPPVAQAVKEAGYPGVAQRLLLSYEEERQSLVKLKFLEKNILEQANQLGDLKEASEKVA